VVKKAHTITWNDGDSEPCFCSFGTDHSEDEGDWRLIDDDDEEIPLPGFDDEDEGPQ
jgi:hypothetical protein